MSDLVASRSPYVDGAFVTGDAGTFAIVDPATEEPVAEVEASSLEQVDTAIAAARRSFDDGPWARATSPECGAPGSSPSLPALRSWRSRGWSTSPRHSGSRGS